MSETDSFIEEVTEEVRKDQLYGYARRYGWILVVIILGAVGWTAYSEWSDSKAQTSAQKLGDDLMAALEAGDAAARAEALSGVAASGDAARDLVNMRLATEQLLAGDADAAAATLQQIVDTSQDALYRDIAQFKLVTLQGADMDRDTRVSILEGLSVAGHSLRPLAKEQLAVLALEEGARDRALEIYGEIYQDSQSTQGIRSRAQQVILALGGELPQNSELLLQQ